MIKNELTPSEIERLFPFYFMTDITGTLLALGPSLRKIVSPDWNGSGFTDFFEVRRPAGSHFEEIVQLRGEMVVLKSKHRDFELMGQILFRESERTYLFVVNLVIQNAEDLREKHLTFDDFAVQDQIFDFLMLLQAHRRAIQQADILNQKLAESHRMAIRASEIKSEFLANMSHELRTPMNGVIGLASVLNDTELEVNQRNIVERILSSGQHMVELVNDILDLTKIEAGHIDLAAKEFNILDVVEEVFRTMKVTADKKNLSFVLRVDDSIRRTLIGDEMRLRQILLNLVGNAIKFTEKGFVELQISVLGGDSKKPKVSMVVKDSGIGMDSETLSRIFKPFVQGDSSMTKKYGGTGLGLSICKHLISAMNGTIHVDSILNAGTTFTVELQLANKTKEVMGGAL